MPNSRISRKNRHVYMSNIEKKDEKPLTRKNSLLVINLNIGLKIYIISITK